MRVKFWGVRGSTPTPQPDNMRYGGNTSCVEVRVGDQIYVFDCGACFRLAFSLGPHSGHAVFPAALRQSQEPVLLSFFRTDSQHSAGDGRADGVAVLSGGS